MLRKLLLSGAVLGATLVAAPTVLGSVGGQSFRNAPFSQRTVASHGWQTAPMLGAGRLEPGVPVRSSLKIANDGSSRTRYLLSARVGGDLRFAGHLRLVITRRTDHATLYSGPLTRLQQADLGAFAPRTTAAFDLSVTLVSAGSAAADDALQARSASVDLGWTATQA